MARLVGLDLDGTLIDSAPDLCASLGQALESLGLPQPTEAQTRSWVGDGIEALIERGLADALGKAPDAAARSAALAAFDAHHRVHFFARSRLYPEVVRSLQLLRDTGLICVCITNKRSAFARPVLDAAGLTPLLDAVYGGDSCARKKPFPDQLLAAARDFGVAPHDAVMVGDSPNDMDAAAAAGWSFVFAAYGYTNAMRSRRVEAVGQIERFADLLPIVCRPAAN